MGAASSTVITGISTDGPVVALRQQLIGYLGNCNQGVPYEDIATAVDAELERVREAHPEVDIFAPGMLQICLFAVPLFSHGSLRQYVEILLAGAKHAPFMSEAARIAQAAREHLVDEPRREILQ